MCQSQKVNTDMSSNIRLENLLMVKFYVVDGVSYPACETAVGIFGYHGYQAMKMCREFGFQNAAAKKSLTLSDYQELLDKKMAYPASSDYQELFDKKMAYPASVASPEAVNVKPLAYYLNHRGFGVTASPLEISMARFYLVDGRTYPSTEERVGIQGRKGFEAMYAVCKLGAFRGAADRKSMSSSDFDARMKLLGLTLV